ncbi:FtsW/RodA/SpoVE family cell cycle protein [Stackebrandtia nassauensis]|uniref:Cell cycle protein n=1 Tax=Stackebrandtia nassauensis (strain DSM 44728 / CIP 108903 / NRRL B-16338 / NBRC 102104 / LLR-40K-21) TaxID=446470 RepID=D3Q5M9_STANL|nr:FtsW/RodA/SpoVE family cell cycle protein [Stackebrandtia nassauensis]ADD46089.1 cell cycle protein [Stackebrandtia nassauensis DSM 44728]
MSTASPARVPTRRNTELALLLVAVLVLFVFEIAVEMKLTGGIQTTAYTLVGTIAAMFVVAHLLVRVFAPYADPVILPAGGLLTGIGIIFIRRLDLSSFKFVDGIKKFTYEDDAERAAVGIFSGDGGKQLMFLVISVVIFAGVLWLIRDHRNLARYPFILGLMGLVALASPITPVIGTEINNSRLWLNLGFTVIQPAEFAKLLLLIFFAYYLVRKREVLSLASKKFLGLPFPRLKDMVPILVVWLAALLVMVGLKDLGTSLLLFGLFVALLYIATERTSWVLIGLLMFAGAVALAYPMLSTFQARVDIWLDPFKDANGTGRQLVQSLIGLGSGGMFGSGPGAGQPQETNPAADSDFIFAGLGEELGLFGLVSILMLYLVLVTRGMRAGLGVRDSFGKLFVGGLSFALGYQVFVVLGGVTKLIPLTGQTAPYLASGGSSLIANWILLALLVRVSDAARRPRSAPVGPIKIAPPPPPPEPVDNSPTQIVTMQQRPSEEEVSPSTLDDFGADETQPHPSPPSASPPTSPEVKP